MIDRQIADGHRDARRIVDGTWERLAARFLSSAEFRECYARVGIPLDDQGMPTQRITVRDGAYRLVPFGSSPEEPVVGTLVDFISEHREAAGENPFNPTSILMWSKKT